MSYTSFKSNELNILGQLCVKIFSIFGLVDIRETKKEGESVIECSNMTLINLTLKWLGPLHERQLTVILLTLQVRVSFFYLVYMMGSGQKGD